LFETREGILKHCSRARARELGDVGERFLKGGSPGLEAQLANLADEIAYNNHDIDDGLRARLLSIEAMREVPLFKRHHDEALKASKAMNAKQERHETIRRIINTLVTDLVETSRASLRKAKPKSIEDVRERSKPLIAYSADVRAESLALKKFLYEHLYKHHQVYRMTVKAQRVVRELFAALLDDPRLLPPARFEEAKQQEKLTGKSGRARVVADYIAGMTDRFALDEHERLFDPRRLR
jgi:dGTPase